MKIKELVTIRTRANRNGGQALMLDYSVDGVRYRESLKMYLVPEVDQRSRNLNMITMQHAQTAKAKKIVEIQSGQLGITPKAKDVTLLDFLKNEIDRYTKKGNKKYAECIDKLVKWLTLYNHRVSLRQVKKEYILDFFYFVSQQHNVRPVGGKGRPVPKKGLSQGTIHQYYEMLGTMFNNAVRQHLINRNPLKDLDSFEKPPAPETKREYLTLTEVERLIATPTKAESTKQAFLFACFTGLRNSDLRGLLWSDIKDIDRTKQIVLRQQKTARLVYIPLSSNALQFLPKHQDKYVFHIPSLSTMNNMLKTWCRHAKINKHISFHCARHTYATLLLTYGADLYTVSKLLGHSNIGVTQVYAKVIDQKRVEAVNMIPTI